MRTAIFDAKFESLNDIREFVAQAARDAGFDEVNIYAIQLSADEASSNIIEHAYKNDPGHIIECSSTVEDGNFILIFKDHGCCFDPALVPEPNIAGKLDERNIGGLGLYLINHLMDEVKYESLGETGNVLTMKKRLVD